MYQKSEVEMELQRLLKIARSQIRLKHSLAAEEEINQVLPALVLEFNKGIQSGELLTLPLDGDIIDANQ